MLHPDRLALARKRRGLTKRALAETLGVAPLTLTRYEKGDTLPSPEQIDRLAEALGFPSAFLTGTDIDQPRRENASFRGMASMLARERDAALAAGAIAFLLSDWVEERFDLPDPDVPDLRGERPQAAARALREHWGLGEKPIKDLVRLLEAKGVRVFSLAERTRGVDAFSLWRRGRPFAFLNTLKSAEHGRFDAAHELGHLVLHRHGAPQGRTAEDEANAFASSFLMPSADVLAVLPRPRSLDQIAGAKKRWGVSVAALNYRLHKLGATTDWQYRTFCIELQRRGWREREPDGMERERSVVWGKVLTALWRERVTRADIARELSVPPGEIDGLLLGFASGSGPEIGGAGPRLVWDVEGKRRTG